MPYERFVESPEEAKEQGFIDAKEAAEKLSTPEQAVPEQFVKAIIRELQVAQLRMPQPKTPEERLYVDVAGAHIACDDIRSRKDQRSRIAEGYIRPEAVERLKPALAQLYSHVKADRAQWPVISDPADENNYFPQMSRLVMATILRGDEVRKEYEGIPSLQNFALDDKGELHTALPLRNLRHIRPRHAGFQTASATNDVRTRRAGIILADRLLNRVEGTRNIEANGKSFPVSDLRMGIALDGDYITLLYNEKQVGAIKQAGTKPESESPSLVRKKPLKRELNPVGDIPNHHYLEREYGIPKDIGFPVMSGLPEAVRNAEGDLVAIPIDIYVTGVRPARRVEGTLRLSLNDDIHIIHDKSTMFGPPRDKVTLTSNAVPKIRQFVKDLGLTLSPPERLP